jgi:hypothetical protein
LVRGVVRGPPTKSTFSNFENKMEKFFRKWTFIFVQNEFYGKSFEVCLKCHLDFEEARLLPRTD